MIKDLWLGTAQWGWTIQEAQAFSLLDAYYESGFRHIDCATNYPINKNAADFRKAEIFISNWLKLNKVTDLKIMMKVGSLNNLRTPDCNLSPSFLLMTTEYYLQLFQTNLDSIMIHWDNRENESEIYHTFEALEAVNRQGIELGLSGIKFPNLYAQCNKIFNFNFYIQAKHNILQSDIQKYEPYFPDAFFIAYGTNGGGIKLNKQEYSSKSVLAVRGGDLENINEQLKTLEQQIEVANKNKERPPITDFFQIGMIKVANTEKFKAIIVAPSTIAQWQSTKKFYTILQEFDYQDIKI